MVPTFGDDVVVVFGAVSAELPFGVVAAWNMEGAVFHFGVVVFETADGAVL